MVGGLMGKAVFSEDRRYRYFLEREVNPLFGNVDCGLTCTFLMLNPSTADETANDSDRCEVYWIRKALGLFPSDSGQPIAAPCHRPKADDSGRAGTG